MRNDQTSGARFSDEALAELGAPQFRHSSTFESEFCSWMESPSVICSTETILDFWKRHADSFPQLSLAARVVVAVPSSSAQIERDFGLSEMVVTADRGSLIDQNVDMICFVNRNDETFTDDTKCKELTSKELKASLSSHPEARIDSQDGAADWTMEEVHNFLAMEETEVMFSTTSIQGDDESANEASDEGSEQHKDYEFGGQISDSEAEIETSSEADVDSDS